MEAAERGRGVAKANRRKDDTPPVHAYKNNQYWFVMVLCSSALRILNVGGPGRVGQVGFKQGLADAGQRMWRGGGLLCLPSLFSLFIYSATVFNDFACSFQWIPKSVKPLDLFGCLLLHFGVFQYSFKKDFLNRWKYFSKVKGWSTYRVSYKIKKFNFKKPKFIETSNLSNLKTLFAVCCCISRVFQHPYR